MTTAQARTAPDKINLFAQPGRRQRFSLQPRAGLGAFSPGLRPGSCGAFQVGHAGRETVPADIRGEASHALQTTLQPVLRTRTGGAARSGRAERLPEERRAGRQRRSRRRADADGRGAALRHRRAAADRRAAGHRFAGRAAAPGPARGQCRRPLRFRRAGQQRRLRLRVGPTGLCLRLRRREPLDLAERQWLRDRGRAAARRRRPLLLLQPRRGRALPGPRSRRRLRFRGWRPGGRL